MADLATPSAAAMTTSTNGTDTPKSSTPVTSTKTDKPDETAYQAALAKAKAAFEDAKATRNRAQEKVNAARPGDKDTPAAKQQTELREKLKSISAKQAEFKASRGKVQDRIGLMDGQLKNRLTEMKAAKSRLTFKSTEEIDARIQDSEKQVDSGKMKLVDEKKTLSDISMLRKQRKQIVELDNDQKQIDTLKAQISEARKDLDQPEYKKLSEEWTEVAKQLDALKVERDDAFKNLNASRDELTKTRKIQDEKFAEVKSIQDSYYQQKRDYHNSQQEYRKKRDEQRRKEQEEYIMNKKMQVLDEKLADASVPAFTEEIRACESLIRLLDPSAQKETVSSGPGKFAAVPQRTVDESAFKGTKIVRKEEEEYFAGTGGKKGKKGKKGNNGTDSNRVDLDTKPETKSRGTGAYWHPDVVEQFKTINLEPPVEEAQVSGLLAQVQEKKKDWLSQQKKQTEENVAAAKKEIEALKSGANDASEAPAAKTNGERVAAAEPAAATNGVKHEESTGDVTDEVADKTEKLTVNDDNHANMKEEENVDVDATEAESS